MSPRTVQWRRGTLLPFVVLIFVSAARPGLCQTNVLTYRNDNQRTGQNLREKVLTSSSVNAASFGKLFTVPVDGKVDAQPLYVFAVNIPGHGTQSVVYAATEHDSVYAFDADSGEVYWRVSLLRKGETTSDDRGCGQVSPEIGITATPVIDLTAGPNGTIYLVAMSRDAANYYQRLHALDIATGQEEFGGPINIGASYPGTGSNSSNGRVVFDPKQMKSRPGLLLVKGVVYTGWGSHCDIPPYTGWLIGYDRLTLKQTSVFNFAPNGGEAALWGSGGGVSADSSGNIFASVANGTFDVTLTPSRFPSQNDFGNAFVKLVPSPGKLSATDYWTMDNTVQESSQDEDLGSGGVLLLPDLRDGNFRIRHLGTGAGKDGNLYVFDRDNMGKFDSSANSTLYQEIPGGLGGGEFGSPAWFNHTIYFGAAGDVIRAFSVTNARLSLQPSSTTALTFAYPGTSPSISANGAQDGILWAFENTSKAVLHAYQADNLAVELYNSEQAARNRDRFGAGNKFMVPTVADGKIFVGTTNSVAVFSLLNHGPIRDGEYQIANGASGLLLDDPGSSTRSGEQIVQSTADNSNHQRWYVAVQPGGFYTIRNVASGLYLTDPGASASEGAPLEQQGKTGDDSQLWHLSASGSAYVISNKASNLVIDDPAFNAQAGTVMILWRPNGGANQSWSIQ